MSYWSIGLIVAVIMTVVWSMLPGVSFAVHSSTVGLVLAPLALHWLTN